MATDRDYYATLQVPRNASQEQIERAYNRLAAQYDPATSRKPRAGQRLGEIAQAYEVLSDRDRRRQYDREISRRQATPGSISPSEVLSNRFLLLTAGTIIASIVVILVAVLLFAGGGDDETSATTTLTFSASPTPTQPIPTPTGPTPSPAPETLPPLEGETITTESGLQYIEILEGAGVQPAANDSVQLWYTGWLQDTGAKFDSAVDRGEPSIFRVDGVIDGFTEGLLGMKEGGKRRLIIPPDLGYGEGGQGESIPPNSTLVFDIELLLVIPGPSVTASPVPTPTLTGGASASATEDATDEATQTP